MNMTANMTAGTNGLNNMTMNMTANMTQNMTAGTNGLNNMTMNMTINQTANMTAGANGLNNMTMNMTANMTQNMTAGTNGLNNMTMNMTANMTQNMTAGANGLNNMTMNMTINQTSNMTANMTMNQTANMTLNMTANTTVYGYVSLMTGSSIPPITSSATIDQMETTTNKNNYIFANFTDGGTETLQWFMDMPSDWNSSDANLGKVSFSPIWTGLSGSGTVEWDIAGKCFPDDAALDTALAAVGTSTDTFITAGDLHISPYSTSAVITSAGTGGSTCIIKVTRNSGVDSYSGTAQLIGIRVKYIRSLTGM